MIGLVEIGETSSSMTRREGLTMARYSMKTEITGDHTPIRWDTKEFNFGITYNNGIITITESGYYKITAACYCIERDPNYVAFWTYVNGNDYLQTNSNWASPGFMYGIIYLDVFDTVYFRKRQSSAIHGGKKKNYFTIEKL